MNFEEIRRLDAAYGAETFARFPIALAGGKGATLTDSEGRTYIDFGAGIGVNIFGVNDEEWKQAVVEQLNCIQHTSNLYYSEPQAKLMQLLCERTGARRVFFGNSGAEANECALKAARKYSSDHYGAGRAKIVTLKGSFHGRTLFTLTATGQEEFHRDFGPFVPEVDYAEVNMQDMRRVADESTCAIMIECVQGEGGVRALDKNFVAALGDFCRARDILLICDEVQCGMGRTGTFCAYEQYGISPDIVTLSKGIAGGLPLGACLFFEKTEHVYTPGTHGSTFGGNPVSCAGAYSVISRLNGDMLLEVQAKSEYLRAKLRGFDGVQAVTGLGMMIGLRTDKDASAVAGECLRRGLLVLTAHGYVRLLPPLSITKREMDEGLTILREVLA